jgi:hypothetical protein
MGIPSALKTFLLRSLLKIENAFLRVNRLNFTFRFFDALKNGSKNRGIIVCFYDSMSSAYTQNENKGLNLVRVLTTCAYCSMKMSLKLLIVSVLFDNSPYLSLKTKIRGGRRNRKFSFSENPLKQSKSRLPPRKVLILSN